MDSSAPKPQSVPNVMAPRHISLTRSPDLPSTRSGMPAPLTASGIVVHYPVDESMQRVHAVVRAAHTAGQRATELHHTLNSCCCQAISYLGLAVCRVNTHGLCCHRREMRR